MKEAEELGGDGRQALRRAELQDRRNELIVQHHLLIGAAFDDVRQRHTGIGLGRLPLQQETSAQRRDFEGCRIARGDGGVGDLELAHFLSHELVRDRTPGRVELAGPAQRHRQQQPLIAHIRGNVDRRRQRVVGRHPERRAVREHPFETPKPDLADLQEVALELDRGEAPAVGHQRLAARLDVLLDIPVLLLKVLRLQE